MQLFKNLREYVFNLFLCIDYLGNGLLFGWPDEWISTRAHRLQHRYTFWKYTRRTIDFVAEYIFGQKNHCFWSYVSDQFWRATPPEKR